MIQPLKYKDQSYLDLVKKLSKFDFDYNQNYNGDIFVIRNNEKVIAAGTLFILYKLHCNPVGQIEDVIVDEEYRGKGLGKKIVEFLIEYGKKKGCYKVVLNCNSENIPFYEKCGMIQSGIQFVKR